MGARTFMRAEQNGARSGWRRGQAAVESAIVLPLFVFIILGLIQLTLAHQAKLMTKYAAYRAARTGSILSAKHSAMERAAMQVLLPMVVLGAPSTGEHHLVFSPSPVAYKARWDEVASGRAGPEYHFRDPHRPADRRGRILDVIICNPSGAIQGNHENFDSPFTTQTNGSAGGGWGRWNKSWLAVQVSFYYRMPIPFANSVLWHLARGDEDRGTMEVLRMERHGAPPPAGGPAGPPLTMDLPGGRDPLSLAHFDDPASSKIFILPLRASYGLRMHSNFLGERNNQNTPDDFKLPISNRCITPE
jgi:hypothetical protein